MINLFKGQKVDLTKNNPGLSRILVGLGWDVNKYEGGSAFDLDAAAFLLGTNGKGLRVLRKLEAQFRSGSAYGRQSHWIRRGRR